MEAAFEIKRKLVETISNINDEELLKDTLDFLEFENEFRESNNLPEELIKKIEIGKEQINNSEVYTNDEANEEIRKWLQGK